MQTVPLVSVVMPIYNEAAFISRSLGAVLAQDYPGDCLDVLVVDGGSTDGTRALVQATAARDGRVRLLDNPARLQASAMNAGLRAAHGEIVARVDGHTIIAPDYIRRCVETLAATGTHNVGGPQRFVGTTPWGRAIAVAYRSPFSVPSRFTVSDRAEYVDTVYMGAWPRAVLEKLGGFDEALAVNEDYELNVRIRQNGGRIYLAPDIRSAYYGRQTPGALWRQFFRYGAWKFTVLRKHPASARIRHLIAPAFVAATVGGAILAPLDRRIARVWRATLGLYAAALGAASLRQASRAGWSHLLRLPVVFATMHVAWGSGFWTEALRTARGAAKAVRR
ncbi:glycosyltransferase family 2 protein [Aggregatilinea lenta]|uniref:glycosyltransferase family 2 protein n=1 Tax=Aggregatilinea lenta TaxID=913108 RepID=UPI000E5C3395|nr:glycosyltransferase family 2 protein [Aggregatilinea lenta]